MKKKEYASQEDIDNATKNDPKWKAKFDQLKKVREEHPDEITAEELELVTSLCKPLAQWGNTQPETGEVIVDTIEKAKTPEAIEKIMETVPPQADYDNIWVQYFHACKDTPEDRILGENIIRAASKKMSFVGDVNGSLPGFYKALLTKDVHRSNLPHQLIRSDEMCLEVLNALKSNLPQEKDLELQATREGSNTNAVFHEIQDLICSDAHLSYEVLDKDWNSYKDLWGDYKRLVSNDRHKRSPEEDINEATKNNPKWTTKLARLKIVREQYPDEITDQELELVTSLYGTLDRYRGTEPEISNLIYDTVRKAKTPEQIQQIMEGIEPGAERNNVWVQYFHECLDTPEDRVFGKNIIKALSQYMRDEEGHVYFESLVALYSELLTKNDNVRRPYKLVYDPEMRLEVLNALKADFPKVKEKELAFARKGHRNTRTGFSELKEFLLSGKLGGASTFENNSTLLRGYIDLLKAVEETEMEKTKASIEHDITSISGRILPKGVNFFEKDPVKPVMKNERPRE